MKMRVNAGQEFVIAGYMPSFKNFDAVVIGYYEASNVIYAARTRNGFTPASRAELFKKFRPLEITECLFANLPEKHAGLLGCRFDGDRRWQNTGGSDPQLVGHFEFVEWTEDAHLRYSRFRALRDDKRPEDVHRE